MDERCIECRSKRDLRPYPDDDRGIFKICLDCLIDYWWDVMADAEEDARLAERKAWYLEQERESKSQ